MVNEGVDRSRVSVCYTGGRVVGRERLTAGARIASDDELDLDDNEMLFLYPARLCAQKQPQVFADTMRASAHEGDRVHVSRGR